jgi:GST-like protein
MWQMGGMELMSGQAGYFRNYTKEKIEHAINRYTNEVNRLYGVLDMRLKDSEFMAGAYSIADMATYPWVIPTPTSARRRTTFPT